MKEQEKIFVKFNQGRKTFTGHGFFSNKEYFKDVKKIPARRDDCIIVSSKAENIHPSLWKDEWFEESRDKP